MNQHLDHHGLVCTGASSDALEAYHQALRAFHCYKGDPLALLEPALQDNPGFAMGHLLHAWLHALSTEPSAIDVVDTDVRKLQRLNLNPRERLHQQALNCFNRGQWLQAGRHLEDLSLQWPRDVLALQAGHLIDFLRGDSRMLRDRIARALPAWPASDMASHAVLGMWSFGLEECGQYEQAERAGQQALGLEPADAWAHHAVAHVYEMQARPADGARWMRSRQGHWDDGHYLAIHNAWHWALFELEQGHTEEALRLYDEQVRADRSTLMVDLVDAASLLWRLQFMGVPVGDRWQSLADDWAASALPGHCAFNDFHAMLAWVGSGRTAQARQWLTAQTAGVAKGDQAMVAHSVGHPLLTALIEQHEGRSGSAVRRLREVRPLAQRMGGSHAQRDLVDLLLLDAALLQPDPTFARALLAERTRMRPDDRINRRAQERLGQHAPSTSDTGSAEPAREAIPA